MKQNNVTWIGQGMCNLTELDSCSICWSNMFSDMIRDLLDVAEHTIMFRNSKLSILRESNGIVQIHIIPTNELVWKKPELVEWDSICTCPAKQLCRKCDAGMDADTIVVAPTSYAAAGRRPHHHGSSGHRTCNYCHQPVCNGERWIPQLLLGDQTAHIRPPCPLSCATSVAASLPSPSSPPCSSFPYIELHEA